MEHFSFIKLNNSGMKNALMISSTEILKHGKMASLKRKRGEYHGGKSIGYLQGHH